MVWRTIDLPFSRGEAAFLDFSPGLSYAFRFSPLRWLSGPFMPLSPPFKQTAEAEGCRPRTSTLGISNMTSKCSPPPLGLEIIARGWENVAGLLRQRQ